MHLTTSGRRRGSTYRSGRPVTRLGPRTIAKVLKLMGRKLDNLRGAAFRPHLLPREPIRLGETGRARSRPSLHGGGAREAPDGSAKEFRSGDWDYRHHGAYDRVTEQGWAKLAKLSERPSARELVKLPITALQALVKRAGMSHGAYANKKALSEQLVEWQTNHPGQALALPLGRARRGRSRRARSQSPARPSEGDAPAPGAQERGGLPNAQQDQGPSIL